MSEYVPTIGLEIHAELNTKTKMFCSCLNDATEARPNTNVCPVCLAHPGTLPVINREAVRHVLRVGTALGSKLATYTEFDRKNYFYPDLPKGYQISQYEYPLVSGGALAGVEITRIHLEEDTASSSHDDETGTTAIDYNRSGVPLMELVTEPVITSAEQAGRFARELQMLLRYLGASEANMEMGQMRVEANVSVGTGGKLGTKVEIKNLNSFNIMERAVAYEIERQKALIASGGTVVQQTLGWDEKKQATFPQRVKEGSADYRYFPDPDLPSLDISEPKGLSGEDLRASLPELPVQRRERYIAQNIKQDDADLFVKDRELGDFFDEATQGLAPAEVLVTANYVANDVVSIMRSSAPDGRDVAKRDSESLNRIPISAGDLRSIMALLSKKELSSRGVKDLIAAIIAEGGDPRSVAEQKGLLVVRDTAAMEAVAAKVIEANPAVVSEIKGGKVSGLEFLLGQCMKEMKGSGDPVLLREILNTKISS